MEPSEIFQKNQVLTVAIATELKGKRIATTSAEYRCNKPTVKIFVVGEMMTEWDCAAQSINNQGNFKTRQDYWRSYMTDKQVNDRQNTILLLNNEGKRIYSAHKSGFYSEPTFSGSDADREVYYVELENEN